MAIEDKSGVGEKIKRYREERGWSQKELAEKADVSPSTISKAEGGIFTPSPDKLQRVADALAIPFSEMVDLKAEMQVDTLLEILSIYIHRQEYDDASIAINELKTRSDL
ncbi:MAG: helix-turn-helix transcriptional regulator, partial [Tumebacillaceae bacterium]